MRNLVRKCRGIGGVSVAKVSSTSSSNGGGAAHAITSSAADRDDLQVAGVMTRARRALAMAAATAEIEKRRKLDHCNNSGELQFAPSYVQIRARPRPPISAAEEAENSSDGSGGGDDRGTLAASTTSRCSSNGSSGLAQEKSLRSGSDLESEGLDFDNYSAARVLGCTRERTSREARSTSTAPKFSDLEAESDDLEQAKRASEASSRRRSTAEMAPSEAELDEFFAAAETAERKRFTEKYNFDVVKEVPLEGRYEWVRLKP